ncbi:MAG TPA: sulfite exporter TauE/SafE family protein [Ilumatobacteraceae bacterium]|nr:sulfite exporter TauE/SafE family protein [Ilumatobacteraceae bacterium]
MHLQRGGDEDDSAAVIAATYTVWQHLFAALAAIGGGLVNAVAGGGTLISFPVLTAIGVPSVRANATNTVALLPGYLGGVYAQRSDLAGLSKQIKPQLVTALIGGLIGSVLLIVTSDSAFRAIVPFLILSAVILMAVQDRIRTAIFKPGQQHSDHPVLQIVSIFAAAVYGGYFGAGLGIMLLAVLGLFSDRPFSQINAVKLILAFSANLTAAIFLSFSGKVVWSIALVMIPAALLGGNLGGRVARIVPAKKMRAFVIAFGFVVAIIYFVK